MNKISEIFIKQVIFKGELGLIYDAKNQPLCMSQFEILKGASRIPQTKRDRYHISFHNPRYITIFYHNQLFKVSTITSEGHITNPIQSLQTILNTQIQQDISLSSICFADSDKAAQLRERYIDENPFFTYLIIA